MNEKLIIIVVAALVGRRRRVQDRLGQAEGEGPRAEGARAGLRAPEEFLVNLADDRFAKLQVALVVEHLPVAAGGHGAPPRATAPSAQEAVVRDIIPNESRTRPIAT